MQAIEIIEGNILKEKSGIIVHGCNCRGKMNKGIALQIRQTYPQVYYDYTEAWGASFKQPSALLGTVVYTRINERLIIASAFTQLNYGYESGKRYVSYDAIDLAFKDISRKAKELSMEVKFPCIGCGLGGGDWNIISSIINQSQLPGVKYTLFHY